MTMINNHKGVTLIELLITLLIISIIVSASFFGYREMGKRLALRRAAYEITSNIEKVREMAMSAQKFEGSIPRGGYGIHFNRDNPNEYVLFADLDLGGGPDRIYTGIDEKVKKIYLERAIEISAVIPSNPINIVFLPPSPDVYLQGELFLTQVEIIIAIRDDPLQTRKIYVNNAGLVSQ